jgi:hypothetical protein
MEKSKRRTLTSPGLGAPAGGPGVPAGSGSHPKHVMSTDPPTSGVRDHEDHAEPRAEKISGRRTRTSRPPVRVDEVGEAAVAIAAKRGRASAVAAPTLLKTRRELESAPINHRDAFILSLIDGNTSVQGVVDLAAMPDGEVRGILERLAGLGIISLP